MFYRFKETCLHKACRSGNKEIVEFLLKHKADPTIRGLQGTGKDLVVEKENPELYLLLGKLMRFLQESDLCIEQAEEEELQQRLEVLRRNQARRRSSEVLEKIPIPEKVEEPPVRHLYLQY
jgi:hypothetical protein